MLHAFCLAPGCARLTPRNRVSNLFGAVQVLILVFAPTS